MTHYISNAFSRAAYFFQYVVIQAISAPFNLAKRVLAVFKSRVTENTPSRPVTKKPHVVSQKLPTLTQAQAATKIQSWFRNKLVATDSTLVKQAKSVMRLSKINPYNSYGDSAQEPSPAVRWEKLKKFATLLEKDHYVFAHSSSFAHSFFVDLRTHLSSKILFPTYSSRWNTHRNFRSKNTPMPFKNITEYFKSNLCYRINAGSTTDDHNQHLILSCDGDLDNKQSHESAYHFFKQNSNISHASHLTDSFFKEHIQNADIRNFAMAYKRTIDASSPTTTSGRVYLIAIPKKTLQDQKTCYVWRSHAYGKVCNHSSFWSILTFKAPHKEFIDVLDKHQKGNTIFQMCQDQYRILAPNLDRDLTKKVFALDSLTESQEKTYKDSFWKLAILLKQVQRLESISSKTSKEDLVSILLRTRFDVKHLAYTTPEMQKTYVKGISNILNSKKNLLMTHATYLQKNLP